MVHEKVKPSRHILLEPNKAYNERLKRILIDNPPVPPPARGPKCETTLLNLDGYEWNTYSEIISKRLLDPKTLPPSQGVNTDILFIANLLLKGLDGERFLTQIIEATIPNQWLHRYGRIRMLVWVPDSVKVRFLPRMMKDRTRTAVINELCTDTRELAGEKWVPQGTSAQELETAYKSLIDNLAKLKNPRTKPEAILPPASALKIDDETLQKERRSRFSRYTLKQQTYTYTPKEEFLGKQLRGKLEKLYNAPGHKPWTPELQHPPWFYDRPDSPIKRPPQPVVEYVRPSTTGRRGPEGLSNKPEWVAPPTELHKPLEKGLRRLPFPDEFTLANGYDAWQLLQAHKHQKVALDDMLQAFDDEVGARDVLPPPPEEKQFDISDTKKQWLPYELSQELGYPTPIFARAGVILEELKAKHSNDDVALAWLKAIATSKRKRQLLEVLEEEYSGQEVLQWNQRTKEPVLTERADAHPVEPIALLDMTAKVLPEWLSGEEVGPHLRTERWEILNYVMRNCFVLRASPIQEAFKTLAPGADAIVLKEESLQEGRKKTRLLSYHEWVRLAEVYGDWPYRDKLDVWEDREYEGMVG